MLFLAYSFPSHGFHGPNEGLESSVSIFYIDNSKA